MPLTGVREVNDRSLADGQRIHRADHQALGGKILQSPDRSPILR